MKRFVFFSVFLFLLSVKFTTNAQVYWCFQVEKNSSILQELLEIKVKYKNDKDKWIRLKSYNILYGNQPVIGYPYYYHLKLPTKTKEFELQINGQTFTKKVNFYSIPDTVKPETLFLMNNINTGSGIKKIPFLYAISKVYKTNIDTNILTIEKYSSLPSLKSEKYYFSENSSIKIDLKAKMLDLGKYEKLKIAGCGAPGTRYIIQKWGETGWFNYLNTWEYKCITTYHEISEHKFAIQLPDKGCYRLLVSGIKGERGKIIDVYSNIFFVR